MDLLRDSLRFDRFSAGEDEAFSMGRLRICSLFEGKDWLVMWFWHRT